MCSLTLEEVLERVGNRIRKLSREYSLSREDKEDLEQDCALSILKASNKYSDKPDQEFIAISIAIVNRRLYDMLRKKNSRLHLKGYKVSTIVNNKGYEIIDNEDFLSSLKCKCRVKDRKVIDTFIQSEYLDWASLSIPKSSAYAALDRIKYQALALAL